MKRLAILSRRTTGEGGKSGVVFCALAFFLLFLMPGRGAGEDAMSIIDAIRKIESSEIESGRGQGEYYGYREGSIPVLISAPHGARHYRTSEGRWKEGDAYTSSLAIKLGQLTGAHVLYVKSSAPEDPNHDVRSRYKDFLGRVVRENGIGFVIDLHGAGRDEPFNIDIGTMDNRRSRSSCPTFKPIIARAFRDFDEEIFNKRFRARGPCTITRFARQTLGIEAAQFEINARYRIMESAANPGLRAKEADVLDLLGRLQEMIGAVNERIARGGAEPPRAVSLRRDVP